MSDILDGEDIVQARTRGESVRSIARRLSCTPAEVDDVLDRLPIPRSPTRPASTRWLWSWSD
jgi:hypothetical protein